MRQTTRSSHATPTHAQRRARPNYAARRGLATVVLLAAVVAAVLAVTGALSATDSGRPGPAGSGGAPVGAATQSTSHTATPTTTTRSSSRTTAAAPARAPFRVGLSTLSVLEPAGAAPANAHLPSGAPARSLPTIIRYPALGSATRGPAHGLTPAAGAGPFGLIVFSQGYNYPAEGYAGLLNAWARAGYVVADPTFPETDPSAPGGPNESDIVNHPRDLRYVITQLLAAARRPSSRLHGLVNPSGVAIAGQSDGGDVSLATAANTCCRDLRVRAAVILSGAELAAFGGRYYAAGSPPMLVTQGDADPINVPGCSVRLYDQAPAPKYYLDMFGQSHLPPYTEPGRVRDHVTTTVLGFLGHYLLHRSGALAAMQRAGTVPGLMSLTSASALGARGTACPGAP